MLLSATLQLTACTFGAQPTQQAPAPKAEAPPAAPAAAGTDKAVGGIYKGKVARGTSFSMEVSSDGKEVRNVTARVLESCSGSSTTSQTTVFWEGPFAVTDGQVLAEGKDEYDFTYRFTATFDGNGGATGTLLQKGVIVSTTCTTYELKWEAQKE